MAERNGALLYSASRNRSPSPSCVNARPYLKSQAVRLEVHGEL